MLYSPFLKRFIAAFTGMREIPFGFHISRQFSFFKIFSEEFFFALAATIN